MAQKPATEVNPNSDRWVIDWPLLRQIVLRLQKGDTSDFVRPKNESAARGYANRGGSWQGFSSGQFHRWMEEGFQTSAIHGLEDFIPPVREKRKFVFVEEGDETHIDMALSGSDVYQSKFTKRDEIPGLALDVEIGMQAGVNAEVLNAFYAWLCRIAFSLDSAGIDVEITLRYQMKRWMTNQTSNTAYTTVIRVKKENEQTDFHSWSPMLSPASFRALMFIANTLHSDARGYDVSSSQGQRERSTWDIEYVPETRTVKINNPWSGTSSFPEELMTQKFREALKSATQNATK